MNIDGLTDLPYERVAGVKRLVKRGLTDPLANWVLPAGLLRWLLRATRSEMAAASWADPGGWKSMVLSYREDTPPQIADRFLIKLGSMPIALRNRKRLVAELLARMIRERIGQPTNVVCLGAGPGHIVFEAMSRANHPQCRAWMLDLNADSFDYGRKLAAEKGLADRVEFMHGDARHYRRLCPVTPHIVKMIGLCEYLPDDVVHGLASAVAEAMPAGGYLVANSLNDAHGSDRFFRRVFDLHMNHRSAGQLGDLLIRDGLTVEHIITEPLGVYDVLVCRKK